MKFAKVMIQYIKENINQTYMNLFYKALPSFPYELKINQQSYNYYIENVRDAKELSKDEVDYKIRKMFAFSKCVYTFSNNSSNLYKKGDKIHRFYDMNMLIRKNKIITIWRNKAQGEFVKVNERIYKKWKEVYPIKNYINGQFVDIDIVKNK